MHSPGSSLGKYDLIEPLGRGGMGTVYKARDRVLDRTVAVKLINSAGTDNDERVGRFAAEAKIVAHLQHPNIIPIYDFGSYEGVIYFVSPLIEGETLAHIIEGGPLSLQDFEDVLRQVASALDYAHAHAVIHRDIKPHNIMIDRQGTAHLMDFGIAKVPEEATLTVPGQLIGTPIYMAPEMFTGQPFDHRVDLYALGLVAFEMLTGKKAFSTDLSMHTTILRIMEGASLRLELLRPDLEKDMVDAVHRALAVNPADRFSKAQDFIDALFPKPLPEPDKLRSSPGLGERVRKWIGAIAGRGSGQETQPSTPEPSPKPVHPAPQVSEGVATAIFRPPSVQTPLRPPEPTGPSEYTQVVSPRPQPPGESPTPRVSTPPAAPSASSSEPGEFTQMLRAPSPPPAKKPIPAARPSSPAEPGEFTRLFQAHSPAASSPSPAGPGEFTQMFQAPSSASPAEPMLPHAAPDSSPAGPGEFIRFFQSPPPSAPPPSPAEPGEFTRAFQSPQAVPSEASSSAILPADESAEREPPTPEPSRSEVSSAAPPSVPKARLEPALPGTSVPPVSAPDATRMFSTSPFPQDSRVDDPNFSAPPGEETRFFAAPSAHSDFAKPGVAPTDVALFISSCVDQGFLGRRVRIGKTPFRIGRNAAEVEFPLSFDQAVSAVHAEIDHTEEGWVIRDLESANGTFLGGKRLVPRKDELLFFGVKILLGTNTQLVFVIHEPKEIPDLSGKTIANGRYLLRQRLHSSVKSAVYVAFDRNLENDVAIKILSPRLAGYPGYCEQFKREAATASRLLHSNICPVIDYGEAILGTGPGTTTPYVTMRHLEGGSLSHRLPITDLDINVAAGWLERICEALDYLDREDVVHGGIRPSAIVFDSREVPYLTDFAFAATEGQGGQRAVIGSPGYLAPEQWAGEPLTCATDQYSLAVLFYYMLTGALPYEDQDNPATREANYKRGPAPADEKSQQAGRHLPAALSPVLHRALQRKPEDRFRTAGEFAKAFRAALQAPEVPIPPVKPESKARMIFMSYHRPSSQYLAILLQRELQAEGYQVFVDSQQRDTVGRFPKKIEGAIERCALFLCLLAPTTLQSSAWVNREIEFAIEKGKQILPVFHDGFIEPPDDADVPPHVRQMLEYDAVRIVDTQSHYITAWLTWLKDSIRQVIGPAS